MRRPPGSLTSGRWAPQVRGNLRGHPGFHAAALVISGPFLPVGPAEPFAGTQRFVARLRAGIVSPPGSGILSRRYDDLGASGRDGVVAALDVMDVIGGHAVDPLFSRDLSRQAGQNASPVRPNCLPPVY